MQNNIEKNQNIQLPYQVVADQSQFGLAIANFFTCYSLEDTESRIFRMLEEWIYDSEAKQPLSSADDASAFIKALKGILDLIVDKNFKPSTVLSAEISDLDERFGIAGTHELLDSLIQSWLFAKNDKPALLDVCNNVEHCHHLIKFTRVLAKEGFGGWVEKLT